MDGVDPKALARMPLAEAVLVVWRFVAANVQLGSDREHQRAVWCEIGELDRYEADDALERSVRRALQMAKIA